MASSLYIHIPYCISKCSYCDFFSVPHSSVPDSYVSALVNEISFRLSENLPDKIKTVYIGGGTPSLLSECQLERISNAITPFLFVKDVEWTMEVNPDDVNEKLLAAMLKSGINRISLGIQAFDQKVLDCVHRRSSLECIKNTFSLIQKNWNKAVSFDVISALPLQSKKSFLSGLENVVLQKPDHISLYSLTIEDETPLGKALLAGKIDYDFDKADEMWLSGRDFLLSNGYVQYEVSNFYLKDKGKPCIHNLSYWKSLDYIGAGSGGTGTFHHFSFDNGKNGFRWTNGKDISSYIDYWNDKNKFFSMEKCPSEIERLDDETMEFEFFMMGLRLIEGICFEDFEKDFCHKPSLKFFNLAELWKKENRAHFYEKNGFHYFTLGEEGILFLNEFLRKLI